MWQALICGLICWKDILSIDDQGDYVLTMHLVFLVGPYSSLRLEDCVDNMDLLQIHRSSAATTLVQSIYLPGRGTPPVVSTSRGTSINEDIKCVGRIHTEIRFPLAKHVESGVFLYPRASTVTIPTKVTARTGDMVMSAFILIV